MLNDFEENFIINEQDLPRSINEFVNDFEDSDVIQLESEFELSTTSKIGESIKLIKSFVFEDSMPNFRLKMGSHIKLLSGSDEMASFNCDSRGSELIMLTAEEVGLTAAGMEITERGASDQVHTGLEVIGDQNFRKRVRNALDQFSSPSILRRSPRLLQKAADSEVVVRDAQVGPLMEVPSSISARETGNFFSYQCCG